jgi:aminodeoxyfutalosine synthase
MRDAGLGSLPGGGAEIFHQEVRDQLCEHKANTHAWLQIHRTAHEIGLRSNCTMLYGHIEQPYHRIDHLIRLRDLQDQTGGFQVFIPLAFHPENTQLSELKKPSALMALRTIAISRLMLDNVRHIKAYWIMLGIGTAQAALAYGADDIDGTVRHELIYHDAGATTPECLSVESIRQLIAEAGREPVERDTLYRRVLRDPGDFTRWTVGGSVDEAVEPSAEAALSRPGQRRSVHPRSGFTSSPAWLGRTGARQRITRSVFMNTCRVTAGRAPRAASRRGSARPRSFPWPGRG